MQSCRTITPAYNASYETTPNSSQESKTLLSSASARQARRRRIALVCPAQLSCLAQQRACCLSSRRLCTRLLVHMFSCCHFGKSRARICSSLTWSLSEKKTRASPIKLPCCTYYTDTELCCRRRRRRRLLGPLGAIQKNDRFFLSSTQQRDTYFFVRQ